MLARRREHLASEDLGLNRGDERETEVRRARVAGRNSTKGETFVHEVTPQMFEIFEGLYEAPSPAELEGARVSVTD